MKFIIGFVLDWIIAEIARKFLFTRDKRPW